MQPITIGNFYKLVDLKDLESLKKRLLPLAEELDLRGTILLAPEGINANLGGLEQNFDQFCSQLQQDQRFASLNIKKSYGQTIPFSKLKIKIKKHILVFDERYDFKEAEYQDTKRMSPAQWDQTLNDPAEDVILLDTRNNYEHIYGAFEGSEHLDIEHFEDFAEEFEKRYSDKKDKKFLVYCTGGIRCEKVTAMADRLGFKECYQLEGGIVSYFKERGRGHWNGSCFVFDFRWAINPDLVESGEGHYLEDGFKGKVHTIPEKATRAIGTWPKPPLSVSK
jgi:UPF0176 protein